MSYPPVLILIIEGWGAWGGGGGGGGGLDERRIFLSCGQIGLSHEEFNLVPERTFR